MMALSLLVADDAFPALLAIKGGGAISMSFIHVRKTIEIGHQDAS